MEYRVSDDDDLEGFKMQLAISNGKVDTLVITKCKKVINKSHEMCTPRPRNYPQSEVTGSSKKPSDYVLSSPTLDHMPKTPLDVNNAFMHVWKSNTVDHMPPSPDAPVYQIDPAIGAKAIVEGFEFKIRSSNKIRFDAISIHKECTWRILARKLNESNWWLLTTVEDVHTCSMTRLNLDHRNVTATVLGALLVDKVAYYMRRGRKKELDMAMGSPAESFAQLPYYCHNLKLANEGTVTHIETDAEGRFKLLYVGFGVAVRFKLGGFPKLLAAGLGTWSRAYCPADRYNYMTSNSAKCINSLTKDIRKLPITRLVDRQRKTLQNWFTNRHEKYKDIAADELTEWAAAKVHRRKLKSAKWIVDEVDKRQVYQVNDLRNVEIVDLDSHECTCWKWQLSRLPCGYVIATSVYLKLTNCCLFAKHWFRKTKVRETYKELVYPLQGPSSWETPADK
ncbi:hypothetical protein Tco_0472490 [Tanacetum coccineum]